MTFVADQREFFDKLITEQWHTYHEEEWAYVRRLEVEKIFDIVQPSRILDIGAGCGFHDREMAYHAHVHSVEAIDYSPASVKRAQEEYPNRKITYRVADFHDLPAEPKYDMAVSFQVFEHLEDPDVYFEKCKAVLRPGGSIAIVMPNWDSLDNRMRDKRGMPRSVVDHLHFKEYTRASVREIAERHGLKEIGHFGHSLSSQFTPRLNKLPYKLRVQLGEWFPSHARIMGSVFA